MGSTKNLKRRLAQHNYGKNVSTANRRPLVLIYFEGHRDKSDALRREKYFKTTKGKVTLRYSIAKDLLKIQSDSK